MDKRKLKDALLEAIAPWMVSEGFRLESSTGVFTRLVDVCDQRVLLDLSRRSTPEAWDIEAHFQIRFEAIEELLNNHKTFMSPSEANHTVTIRASLTELSSGAPKRLVDASGIEDVLGELLERISTYGLLFFHRWATIRKVQASYEGASTDWPEADPIRRCENLLTIYALNGDRRAFDQHATKMLRFMAEHRGGFYHDQFEQIVTGLAEDPVWLRR